MPGVERRETAEVFLGQAVARLFEEEKLVLCAELWRYALLFRAGEHPLECRTRAAGMRLSRRVAEVAQHCSNSGLPRDRAQRARVEDGQHVRVSRMRAGEHTVVVDDITDIPAENDVAEAEPWVERGRELVEGDVLASEHAVDVEPADFGRTKTLLLEAFDDRTHGRPWSGFRSARRRATPRQAALSAHRRPPVPAPSRSRNASIKKRS